MTANERMRLERVEALLAGNGIDTDNDGVVDMVGEAALAYAADPLHGWSAFYGIALARQEAAAALAQGLHGAAAGSIAGTHKATITFES